MKNLSLNIFALLFVSLLGYSAHAQQTINYGDSEPYSVDLADGPNGTLGSSYQWKVFDTGTPATEITNGGTLTIIGQGSNVITINWGTTPPGVYTLQVEETNNFCLAPLVTATVTILPPALPILTATNANICVNDPTDFEISGAPANSIITFTVTGGTAATTPSPITTDISGNATITVDHDGTSAQIVVTLTNMQLPGGTSFPLPPTQATTNVTIVTTSTISFTP